MSGPADLAASAIGYRKSLEDADNKVSESLVRMSTNRGDVHEPRAAHARGGASGPSAENRNIMDKRTPSTYDILPDNSPRRVQAFLSDLRNHSYFASAEDASKPLEPPRFEGAPQEAPRSKNLDVIRRKAMNVEAELADLVEFEQNGAPDERAIASWYLSSLQIPRAGLPSGPAAIPAHVREYRRSSQSSEEVIRLDHQWRYSGASDDGVSERPGPSPRYAVPPRFPQGPPGPGAFPPSYLEGRRSSDGETMNPMHAARRMMPPPRYALPYPRQHSRPGFPVEPGAGPHGPPRPSLLGDLGWNQGRNLHAADWLLQRRRYGLEEERRASDPAAEYGSRGAPSPPVMGGKGKARSKRKSDSDCNEQKTLVCHVCQSEVDVEDIKRYIRCRKICNTCRTSLSCSKNGQIVRYCQLCSWVHPLEDFDGDRRSCRSELMKHNMRRRKKAQVASGGADGNMPEPQAKTE